MIFGHSASVDGDRKLGKAKLPKSMQKRIYMCATTTPSAVCTVCVRWCSYTSLDLDPTMVMSEFDGFVARLVPYAIESAQEAERELVQGR